MWAAETILKEKETEIACLKETKETRERELQKLEKAVIEKNGILATERENLLRDGNGLCTAEKIYQKNLESQGFESTEAFINAVLSGEEIQKLKDTGS